LVHETAHGRQAGKASSAVEVVSLVRPEPSAFMTYISEVFSVPYEELGEDYFDRRRSSEVYAKKLVRQLERLGHKVAL
jgi:hypothetical protein